MAINRADIAKELLPGLNAIFGLEYGMVDDELAPLYEVENSEKAFEEKNKDIKSETTKTPSGEAHQGVKGASQTISTKGAQKGTTGSKNKADYKKEARDKKIASYKAATKK